MSNKPPKRHNFSKMRDRYMRINAVAKYSLLGVFLVIVIGFVVWPRLENDEPVLTKGISFNVCMIFSTVIKSWPNFPPGCKRWKSCFVKLRRDKSATEIASPNTNIIVEEVVGASPMGQAS